MSLHVYVLCFKTQNWGFVETSCTIYHKPQIFQCPISGSLFNTQHLWQAFTVQQQPFGSTKSCILLTRHFRSKLITNVVKGFLTHAGVFAPLICSSCSVNNTVPPVRNTFPYRDGVIMKNSTNPCQSTNCYANECQKSLCLLKPNDMVALIPQIIFP